MRIRAADKLRGKYTGKLLNAGGNYASACGQLTCCEAHGILVKLLVNLSTDKEAGRDKNRTP